MASNILFKINAEEVLAKLHLAGRMACEGFDQNTSFIVNAGIKNDDHNASPDNPGKVKFMLDNSSGEYELGFVTQLGPYGISTTIRRILPQVNQIFAKFKTINISNEKIIVDDQMLTPELGKSYAEAWEVLWKNEKNRKNLKDGDNIDAEAIVKEYAQSKIKEIDTELKKVDEQLKKAGVDADNAEEAAKEDKDEQSKEQKEEAEKKADDKKDDAAELMQRKKKLTENKARCEDIVKNPVESKSYTIGLAVGTLQAILAAINEATKNDANSEETIASQKEARQKAQTLATDNLQKYMNVFAGPEAAKSFNAKDIIMIYVTQDAKSPNDGKLVSNFQILPIADAELEKHRQQQETDPSKCIDKVCFKMGFKVSVDK